MPSVFSSVNIDGENKQEADLPLWLYFKEILIGFIPIFYEALIIHHQSLNSQGMLLKNSSSFKYFELLETVM